MNAPSRGSIVVRPVREEDRPKVQALVRPFVEQQRLLERTISELDELLSSGHVAEHEGELVGFAALQIYSPKLAEIRSLAVAESFQGKGVGRLLVEACLEQAQRHEVMEVMAISSSEAFFRACGFDYTLPGEKKAFFFSPRSGDREAR